MGVDRKIKNLFHVRKHLIVSHKPVEKINDGISLIGMFVIGREVNGYLSSWVFSEIVFQVFRINRIY